MNFAEIAYGRYLASATDIYLIPGLGEQCSLRVRIMISSCPTKRPREKSG